jgi:hypothetical protein
VAERGLERRDTRGHRRYLDRTRARPKVLDRDADGRWHLFHAALTEDVMEEGIRSFEAGRCEGRLGRLAARFHPSLSRGGGSGSTNSSRTRQATTHPAFYGRPVDTPGLVAVTYDQNASDGLGAQLQRIYGLYALSRALDIKYVHTPLGQVDYQGLMPLLSGRTDPDFAARCNSFFALPSDNFDLDGCERLLVPYPNEKRIEHYRRYSAVTGRPVLLRAHEPYGYTDPHPEAYLAVRAVSPYRDFRREGPNVRPKQPYLSVADRIAESIGSFNAIHVRRGDFRYSRMDWAGSPSTGGGSDREPA